MDFRIWLLLDPGSVPMDPCLRIRSFNTKSYVKHFGTWGQKELAELAPATVSSQGWCHIADIGALNIGHQQLVMVPTLAGFSDIGRIFSWHWLMCP